MNKKRKLFGVYLPVFAIATPAAVILRCIGAFMHFDYTTGYFTKSIPTNIADAIVTAAVIFFISYIFTAKKDMRFIPGFTEPTTYVPTGIVAVALLFLGFDFAKKAFLAIRAIADFGELTAQLMPSVLLIAGCTLLCFLSAVHFAITSLIEAVSDQKRAVFGLCTVLFLALLAIILYFDTSRPINAPNKVLDETALLFASVFFLYETRLSIGREKWREYIAFGFISAMLCAYSSVPVILSYLIKSDFKEGLPYIISENIYISAVIFALFIFISSRLLITGELIEDKVSPAVNALIEIANAREVALTPEEPAEETAVPTPEEEDDGDVDTEHQITIEEITAEAEPPKPDEDTPSEA